MTYNEVFVVTVTRDISEDPVRFVFAEKEDAVRYVEEYEPSGEIYYEPIIGSWSELIEGFGGSLEPVS